MVAHLIRLKLLLLRNSLRRSTGQLIGLILGGLYGLGILVLVVAGLVALGGADTGTARTVVVLGGSAVVAGWVVIPLVAAGVDMTLDPARFVTFAVPLPTLLAGLVAAGAVGVPGVVTLLAALGQVGTWWRHPAAAGAAVVCSVLAVILCVVLSRLVTTAGAGLSGSRRFKDLSAVVAMVPLILLGPIFAGIAAGVQSSPQFVSHLASVLAWTPLGAFWSVPADIAAGEAGAALGKLLIGVAAIGAGLWLWKLSLAHALVTPVHTAAARRGAGRMGFFNRLPSTPTGAVAARCLTYWVRDPRYGASVVLVPLLPVLLFFLASQGGSYTLLNFVGPITAFFLAWSIAADISYDNTAFWMHVSAGVTGAADRAGRALALGLIAVPVGLVFTVVPLGLSGSLDQLPVMLGLTFGVLLTGMGLSSVVSARYTYNVPLPGESPFKTPPGSAFAMLAVNGIGMAVLAGLVLPEIILAVIYWITGNPLFGWLVLLVGLGLGSVLLFTGIRQGGRWYNRRAPELLLAVSRNK